MIVTKTAPCPPLHFRDALLELYACKNPALKRQDMGTEREISLCDIVECVTHGRSNQNPPFKGGALVFESLYGFKHLIGHLAIWVKIFKCLIRKICFRYLHIAPVHEDRGYRFQLLKLLGKPHHALSPARTPWGRREPRTLNVRIAKKRPCNPRKNTLKPAGKLAACVCSLKSRVHAFFPQHAMIRKINRLKIVKKLVRHHFILEGKSFGNARRQRSTAEHPRLKKMQFREIIQIGSKRLHIPSLNAIKDRLPQLEHASRLLAKRAPLFAIIAAHQIKVEPLYGNGCMLSARETECIGTRRIIAYRLQNRDLAGRHAEIHSARKIGVLKNTDDESCSAHLEPRCPRGNIRVPQDKVKPLPRAGSRVRLVARVNDRARMRSG